MQKPAPETDPMTVAIAAETRPGIHIPSLPDIFRRLVALQRRHREPLPLAEMADAALQAIGLRRCDVRAEIPKPRRRRGAEPLCAEDPANPTGCASGTPAPS